MVDGPRAALALVDALAAAGTLHGYHLLHAARSEQTAEGEIALASREVFGKVVITP